MEHLFLELDLETAEKKICEAYYSLRLRDDDPEAKLRLVSPVEPFTEWLGFDHDAGAPALTNPFRILNLEDYAVDRGWNFYEIFQRQNLRGAHPDLADKSLDEPEVSQRVAAFLQSWLYFGFIEAIVRRKVYTNYLVRKDDSSGKLFLHTGNLDFLVTSWSWYLRIRDDSYQSRARTNLQLHLKEMAWYILQLREFADAVGHRGAASIQTAGFAQSVASMLPAILRLYDVFLYAAKLLGAVERDNIDTSTYKTQHRSPDCTCISIKPEHTAIFRAIENGNTPVIKVQQGQTTGLVVEEYNRDWALDPPYVALSHVWADGLGSCTEAGLPQCQLLHIAQSLQALTGSSETYFWIDSLCIPNSNVYRKKAIGLMRQVYEDAEQVLVIDKALADLALKTAKRDEILWALQSSSWVRRLWTFQEGYLGRKVSCQVADHEFVEIKTDTEYEDMEQHKLFLARNVVYWHLSSRLADFRGARPDLDQITIGTVMRAVGWRSTSKRGDETLAIAGLFKLDATKLAALPAEDRLRAFYLMVGEAPLDIIFHPVPRLQTPNFGWAPQTLLSRSEFFSEKGQGEELARCTEEGLLGRWHVMWLSKDIVSGGRPVFILQEKSYFRPGRLAQVITFNDELFLPRRFNAVILIMISEATVASDESVPAPEVTDAQSRGAAVFIQDDTLSTGHRVCSFVGNVWVTTKLGSLWSSVADAQTSGLLVREELCIQ